MSFCMKDADDALAQPNRYQVYVDKQLLEAFNCEATARIYMDEQAAMAQTDVDNNQLDESFLYSVKDADADEILCSAAVHPRRPKFDRASMSARPRVDVEGPLSIKAMLGGKK
jgi:hypothetical protein